MSLHRRSRLHVGHIRWHHRESGNAPSRTTLGANFDKLWAAGISSNVADGITYAALPLLTAVLTRDPMLVALVVFLHSLPWFVFELFAGEIVDRVDRKRLMLWGNLARAVGISLIAVLSASDLIGVPLLGAIAFFIGVAETIVDTSWEALVPRLVPAGSLEIANGRTQAAEWTANELLGPPLGGFLFAAAVSVPFFVNGGAFVLAALLIAWIPGVYRAEREVAHGRGSMRKEIGEGIKWLWAHPVLRSLSLMAGTANLMGTAMFTVFVLFAQDILGLGNVGFGVILSTSGIGGIVGAATAHRVERRLGPGTMLLGSMIGIGFTALAIALTSSPIIVGAAFVVDAYLVAMWNVVVVSLRQALTPDALRGRVSSDARMIAFGAIPLGALLGGLLGNVVGLRAPFFTAAAVYAFAVVVMSRFVSNAKIAALRAEAA